MLIYSYKGKYCPTSTSEMHNKNVMAILYYNRDILNKGNSIDNKIGLEKLLRQVYNTYTTLCRFNNLLSSIQDEIDVKLNEKDFKKASDKKTKAIVEGLNLLSEYLTANEDVATQYYDNKIQNIYNELKISYARLNDNINSLSDIKKKIVSMMKYYVKLGLFVKSSINLKENEYDYV